MNELLEKEKLYTDPTLNRDDLAQRLGTNRTYLMEAVRTYGGNMTVREYIYDFRLKHAAELLSSPSALSIDQICYDSGFASRSVFYRLFRQSYGLSPNEYRKLADERKRKLKYYISKTCATRTNVLQPHRTALGLLIA